MRINCGDCQAVREAKERQYVENWHPVFLLWPRRMTYSNKENDCRWLERVQIRFTWKPGWRAGTGRWRWEYKPL